MNFLKKIATNATLALGLALTTPEVQAEESELETTVEQEMPVEAETLYYQHVLDELYQRGVIKKDIEDTMDYLIKGDISNIKEENMTKAYYLLRTGTYKHIFDFVDTEKPNALMTLPHHDHNLAFYRNTLEKEIKALGDKYDLKVVITKDENELYEALDSTPNIELLWISGHGEPHHLQLSDIDSEEGFLDISDEELEEHIDNLSENAVIMLDSCSTGRTGVMNSNLAEHVAKITLKKVYSSKVDFSPDELIINNIYPLDVSIISEGVGHFGKDDKGKDETNVVHYPYGYWSIATRKITQLFDKDSYHKLAGVAGVYFGKETSGLVFELNFLNVHYRNEGFEDSGLIGMIFRKGKGSNLHREFDEIGMGMTYGFDTSHSKDFMLAQRMAIKFRVEALIREEKNDIEKTSDIHPYGCIGFDSAIGNKHVALQTGILYCTNGSFNSPFRKVEPGNVDLTADFIGNIGLRF